MTSMKSIIPMYMIYYRRRVKISYKPNLTVPMSMVLSIRQRSYEGYFKVKLFLIGDSEEISHWSLKWSKRSNNTRLGLNFPRLGITLRRWITDFTHLKEVRELEAPIFIDMFKNHKALDQAFKKAKNYLETSGNQAVIDTETNVHLFTMQVLM